MLKKSILILSMAININIHSSEESPKLPIKEVVTYHVCPSTLGAAHSECFITTRCSQKCVSCNKWDMYEASKKEAKAIGIDLSSECLLCDKLLKEKPESPLKG